MGGAVSARSTGNRYIRSPSIEIGTLTLTFQIDPPGEGSTLSNRRIERGRDTKDIAARPRIGYPDFGQ